MDLRKLELYSRTRFDDPLDQGDIIERCPIPVFYEERRADDAGDAPDYPIPPKIDFIDQRVVVMTQACELRKTSPPQLVVVCPVYTLVDEPVDQDKPGYSERFIPKGHRGNVENDRHIGLHYLASVKTHDQEHPIPPQIVDFKAVYTVPRRMLETLARSGNRPRRLGYLFREHLSLRFAYSYFRIGLPEVQ